MIQEFKDFIANGNVFDAAVGLIMALAFIPVVDAFVDGVLMQIIAAIFGEPDFGGLTFDIGEASIKYGSVINAVITFLGVALAVFMMVKAYNKMRGGAPDPDGPSDNDLLKEIRDSLASR